MYENRGIPVYLVPWEYAQKYKPGNVALDGRFRLPVVVEKRKDGTVAVFYFQSEGHPFGPKNLAYLVNPNVFRGVLEEIAKLRGLRDNVVGHRKAYAQAQDINDTTTNEMVTVPVADNVTLKLYLLRRKTDGAEYPIRDEVRTQLTETIQRAWDVVARNDHIEAGRKAAVFPREIIEVPPNRSVLGENHLIDSHTLLVARKDANLDAVVDIEGILAVLLHEIAHAVAPSVYDHTPTMVFNKMINKRRIDHGEAFHLALGRLFRVAIRAGYIKPDSNAGRLLGKYTTGFTPTSKIYSWLVTDQPVDDIRLIRFSRGANGKLKELFDISADFLEDVDVGPGDAGQEHMETAGPSNKDTEDAGPGAAGEERMETTGPPTGGTDMPANIPPARAHEKQEGTTARDYAWIDLGDDNTQAPGRANGSNWFGGGPGKGPAHEREYLRIESDDDIPQSRNADLNASAGADDSIRVGDGPRKEPAHESDAGDQAADVLRAAILAETGVARSVNNARLYKELNQSDGTQYARAVLCLKGAIVDSPSGIIDTGILRKNITRRCPSLSVENAKRLINQELFIRPDTYNLTYDRTNRNFVKK